MKRIELQLNKLEVEAFSLLKNYLLITSGENKVGEFNSMTVDWGFFGSIWRSPCVLLSIRPTRYTYEFISKCNDFTVSSFPKCYKDVLTMLGSKSGRDTDKMNESGLTAMASSKVLSPSFEEASLSLECKKLFVTDVIPEDILDEKVIPDWYPKGNFHKLIIGEIIAAYKNV